MSRNKQIRRSKSTAKDISRRHSKILSMNKYLKVGIAVVILAFIKCLNTDFIVDRINVSNLSSSKLKSDHSTHHNVTVDAVVDQQKDGHTDTKPQPSDEITEETEPEIHDIAQEINAETLKQSIVIEDKIQTSSTSTYKATNVKYEKVKMPSKQLLTQYKTKPSNKILSSFPLWSQYLHALVYKNGVPINKKQSHMHFNQSNGGFSYDGYAYTPPLLYKKKQDGSNTTVLLQRKDRFPSVQERIKYYMGSWYDVKNAPSFPSPNNSDKLSQITYNPMQLNPHKMWKFCRNYNKVHKKSKKRLMQSYVRDIIDLSILHSNLTSPIYVKFGDEAANAISYPVFGKTRDLQSIRKCTNKQKCVKDSTIIWPMNRIREHSSASQVPMVDIPYEQKIPKLIWRGKKPPKSVLKDIQNVQYTGWKKRHFLFQKYHNSSIIDAKYTSSKNYLSKKSILRYKYILSLESASISSSLKWILFSNSLLFLVKPITYISYAMENLLQPFVHYVPVKSDLSNLEEMVQWAEENQALAKSIAVRGTLFIWDLLFHEDSYKDEEDVLMGIMERYERNFGSA